MNIEIIKPSATAGLVHLQQIRDFLFTHLDQYGDKKEDIMKAINYALNIGITPGGFVLVGRESDFK